MGGIPTGSHGHMRSLEGTRFSPQFEGRFGRMLRTLWPVHFDEDDLRSLTLSRPRGQPGRDAYEAYSSCRGPCCAAASRSP